MLTPVVHTSFQLKESLAGNIGKNLQMSYAVFTKEQVESQVLPGGHSAFMDFVTDLCDLLEGCSLTFKETGKEKARKEGMNECSKQRREGDGQERK